MWTNNGDWERRCGSGGVVERLPWTERTRVEPAGDKTQVRIIKRYLPVRLASSMAIADARPHHHLHHLTQAGEPSSMQLIQKTNPLWTAVFILTSSSSSSLLGTTSLQGFTRLRWYILSAFPLSIHIHLV